MDDGAADRSARVALDELKRQVNRLEELQDELHERAAELAELSSRVAAANALAEVAEATYRCLGAVGVPDGLASVIEAVATVDLELGLAQKGDDAATKEMTRAEAVIEQMPDREEMEVARSGLEQLAWLDERILKGTAVVVDATDGLAARRRSASAALETLRVARAGLDVARLGHDVDDPAGLDELGGEVESATVAAGGAEEALRKAEADHAGLAGKLAALGAQRVELAGRLEGEPDTTGVLSMLSRLDGAQAALDRARAAAQSAADQRRAAERRRLKVQKMCQSSWSVFEDIRDGVADLGPPRADRDDLQNAWGELTAWATGQLPTQEIVAAESRAAALAAEEAREVVLEPFREVCRRAGLELHDGIDEVDLRSLVSAALADRRSELARAVERDARPERLGPVER